MIFNVTGGGGGTSQNFDVTAYTTEAALMAATPKENTIGIITSTPITSYAFSSTEPVSPESGMVWITTGTASGVEFNALEENILQVYPISAKQYVSGAWVVVEAMSYQGGAWVEWMKAGYLYDSGNQYEEITGGWAINNASEYAVCAHESDHISLGYTKVSNLQANIYTQNMITFPYENFKTLKMLITVDSTYTVGSSGFGLTKAPSISGHSGYAYLKTFTQTGTEMELSLDISSASGDYYVSIYSIAESGKIHKIWLE